MLPIMPETEAINPDSQRSLSSLRGHPLPRRASPANSITLKHHRLARDASLRASAGSGSGPANNSNSNTDSSPRRNSSGESHDTGRSDPKKWFDKSNQNPTATFDNNVMDVDPPFFQKESDSSNEDRPFHFQQETPAPRHLQAQSSSADDYRSVIDDLTVEIQKLKEELKRYKPKGPDLMRKEKLFEIKIHGLPKRKKRELETTLRDFAAGLEGSPDTSSTQQRKGRHATRENMYGGSGSMSKHASSSSGSNPRPVDSAYASMSTGAHSSGTSLGRPSSSLRASSSEQKVQNYLRDIPEGLYPRQTVMTDKEKRKLVVRRLEQLFTGKITGRGIRRILPPPPPANPNTAYVTTANDDNDKNVLAPVTSNAHGQQQLGVHHPPNLPTIEPSREAQILSNEQRERESRKKSNSRDNGSASNSNGDQTEGNSTGDTNSSPSQTALPEQRPTRPKDLDPDRVQVPSENMQYIRHLGLVPPELLADATRPSQDVHPDAEGWVYLNLLCNLAQLHIINVTPSFVRSSVSEMSTKFQLSPDGRKIRWRGGSENTRFASESSGNNSQRDVETGDSDGSNKNKQRKRQKTTSTSNDLQSGGSSGKNPCNFVPQTSASSESFHYKPLFVQQESYNGGSSPEDTLSSFGPIEDSNVGESGWDQSGTGTSNRRKRRHDGAIIYYNGAPFCTDLSGDMGDVSPTTYMMSSGQTQQDEPAAFERPIPFRSASGSSLKYRPLSDYPHGFAEAGKVDVDGADPGLTADSGDDVSDIDFDMPWTNDQQYIEVRPLEPCGLGGVLPEDHFMVVVTTARPKVDSDGISHVRHRRSSTEEVTEGIIGRLETMSTSSPKPIGTGNATMPREKDVEIQYMSGRIKRLAPVPLPPPAIFFPPFSTNTSMSDEQGMSVDMSDSTSSEGLMSRRANPHQSDGYPDGVDLTSGDEDGEDPDDEPDAQKMYDMGAVDDEDDDGEVRSDSAEAAAGTASRGRSKSVNPGGSSAAGVPSAFSSSEDDSTGDA